MQDHAERLYYALKKSWSGETSGFWSRENPAKGQGSVTALVVQDILGGELAKTAVSGTEHFYNIVEGTRWDFTFSQFDVPVGYQDRLASRTEAMATITPFNMPISAPASARRSGTAEPFAKQRQPIAVSIRASRHGGQPVCCVSGP
nr:hypothetical protein [Agrobacterium salinitolerans]